MALEEINTANVSKLQSQFIQKKQIWIEKIFPLNQDLQKKSCRDKSSF